ncbi:hypothetical protein K435DRAFT_963789 [Dendrothele bispora CBS 962.96]|uniref:Uncharacterized protein n=1 Tax=Dendrothele bispora (strain CBS 962.96) TaxID=1314807 RepID=A0A4S8MF96_DENBC|nr:hypothetical protein K435DRAFT_963789 [Dendrothele bispora CBS 962.96]
MGFPFTGPYGQSGSAGQPCGNAGLFGATGYLVDAFVVDHPQETFSTLLLGLRQHISLFREVIHVYESRSNQSFLVHVPLFLIRVANTAHQLSINNPDNPSFIRIRSGLSEPEIFSTTPSHLLAALLDLGAQLNSVSGDYSTVISPSEGLPFHVNVPLAAFILEYPVVYCPDASAPDNGSGTYLSRVPLDVYEGIVSFTSSSTDISGVRTSPATACSTSRPENKKQSRTHMHTLLKFSCPAQLGESSGRLTPASLISKLESQFITRITRLDADSTFKVQHTTVTLDGVAL